MKRTLLAIIVSTFLLTIIACATDNSLKDLSDQALLAELLKVDQQSKDAFTNGDRATLEKVLADDYAASSNGKVYGNKQQSLEVGSKPSGIRYPQPENPKLTDRTDNSAEITFEQTARVSLGSSEIVQRSTVREKFVKRDGRIQIVSFDVTDIK